MGGMAVLLEWGAGLADAIAGRASVFGEAIALVIGDGRVYISELF